MTLPELLDSASLELLEFFPQVFASHCGSELFLDFSLSEAEVLLSQAFRLRAAVTPKAAAMALLAMQLMGVLAETFFFSIFMEQTLCLDVILLKCGHHAEYGESMRVFAKASVVRRRVAFVTANL